MLSCLCGPHVEGETCRCACHKPPPPLRVDELAESFELPRPMLMPSQESQRRLAALIVRSRNASEKIAPRRAKP